MRPIIGIAANLLADKCERVKNPVKHAVEQDYIRAVEQAGGIPVVIPVQADRQAVLDIARHLEGILLIGGSDINPVLYRHRGPHAAGQVYPLVDQFYLDLIQAADALKLPVFGICKGLQALNVAFGGTLHQDLPAHVQDRPMMQPSHRVRLKEGSLVGNAVDASVLEVNSFHHQAVKDLAPGFEAVAFGEDGVIEALERQDQDPVMVGVQWHPEILAKQRDEASRRLFEAFVRRCGNRRQDASDLSEM